MFAHFAEYTTRVREPLDAAFQKTLEKLLGDAARFGPSADPLSLREGKKVRGSLLCLVSETFGGDLDAALPRAVAVELVQTATLLHDDYVDQHHVRRKRPAVWTVEGGRKAVLMGDVVFASAIRMMSELGQEDCLIISGAIAEVSLGAYQEPLSPQVLLEALQAGRITGELYQRIIHLKTAILFGAACELGAVAARASERVQMLLRNYGYKIGEAYQIADDLHEVENALEKGSLTAAEATELAPALLYFVPGIKPHLVAALQQGGIDVTGEVAELVARGAAVMTTEREARLETATAWIEEDLPENLLNRLVLSAPRELIALFNAQHPAPCAQ